MSNRQERRNRKEVHLFVDEHGARLITPQGQKVEVTGERLDVGTPAYCAVHQHHKWCEHNGGVMGMTGYERPGPDEVDEVQP